MLLILPIVLLGLSVPVLADIGTVYPEGMKCGEISSGFGDVFDLDGARRDVRHEGIDLGNLGDPVIAPGDGTVLAIWAVHHKWGTDWNLLIRHSPEDLNLIEPGSIYVSELDHLQSRDMPMLKPGDRLSAGQIIGRVRHPGDNQRFAPEVHLELYRLPDSAWGMTEWDETDGRRFWWNEAAELIDPLWMLTRQNSAEEGVPGRIHTYSSDPDTARIAGFVYPLLCS